MSAPDHIARAEQAWKALGVPATAASSHPARVLLACPGCDGKTAVRLAKAARREFSPDALWLLHDAAPPPRATFQTLAGDLSGLVASHAGTFDLVLVPWGLENGALAEVADRMRAIAALTAPGGLALLGLETFAAPLPFSEVPPFSGSRPGDPAGTREALLFPELAQAGELGAAAATRAPLPAAAWLGLIATAGFDVETVAGYGEQPLPQTLLDDHAARLAVFDATELASGVIQVQARRGEAA